MSPSDTYVPVDLRWLIRKDLPEILDIEQQSFEFPWTEDDFLVSLKQRNCIGMVAVYDSRIAGYMLYLLNDKTLTLINVAVHPDFRRRKVGTQLMAALQKKLVLQGRHKVVLSVRESNLPAQLFFKSNYFLAIGVDRSPYDECDEAAYTMRYHLPLDDLLPTQHQFAED